MDIEVLFRTLRERMERMVEFKVRNDMPIPHADIRAQVETENDIQKKTNISL